MKKVLIFPAGSEVGLEIYESLCYSTHYKIIGANSVEDHSSFIFKSLFYLPMIFESDFLVSIKELIKKEQIDFLYPTMDEVAFLLKSNENFLGVNVIGSPLFTYSIANDKKKTYEFFKAFIKVPETFKKEEVVDFPVFLKPKLGYGSRGTSKVNSKEELDFYFKAPVSQLLLEYLPGEEFTVDCFTNKEGNLLYCSPRTRERIRMGISVHSQFASEKIVQEIRPIAELINKKLEIRSAWFFQVKRSNDGELALMEIGLRPAGSSGLNRLRDVNLPLLSLFDMDGCTVHIKGNSVNGKIDRAFSTKAKIHFEFDQLFIDFDDCVLINNRLNHRAIELIIHCRNSRKYVTLISKHKGDLEKKLNELKIYSLFDKVIHLEEGQRKGDYLIPNSLFVDDSFSERQDASLVKNVFSFGVESIGLINSSFLG